MTDTPSLSQMERYARAVLAAVNGALASREDSDPHAAALRDLARRAERVIARAVEPVSIGIVGAFSAGKTRLIGALAGYGDLLPVDERPCTGNVTVLRFLPSGTAAGTELSQVEIEYLTAERAALCLAYMLLEVRESTGRARLDDADGLRATLDALLGPGLAAIRPDAVFARPLADAPLWADWQQRLHDPELVDDIQKWGRQVWGRTDNPGLRQSIRELTAFVRAYDACGTAMCDGRRYPFFGTDESARALTLLQLDDAQRDMQGIGFDDLPAAPPALHAPPDAIDPVVMRATFPLVARVHVEVVLPAAVWRLERDRPDAATPSRFQLYDFPGLGADASSLRDRYLCLTELQNVQTILILLNGRVPGGSEGKLLFDLMQGSRKGQNIQDHILVGVGRFDQLPLTEEQRAVTLPALAGRPAGAPARAAAPVAKGTRPTAMTYDEDDDAPAAASPPAAPGRPLSESEVTAGLPILNTCVAQAEALVTGGRRDRIVLLSPVLHLQRLNTGPLVGRVGSSAYLTTLAGEAATATDLAPLWGAVAARLGGGEKSGMARWLSDLATDGGVGRLRQVLLSHVENYGLDQLATDTRLLHKELRDALAERAGPADDRPRVTRTWEDRKARGKQVLEVLLKKHAKALADLQTDRELSRQVDGRRVKLAELLKEEVADDLFDWPEWRALMDRSQAGLIDEAAGANAGVMEYREEDDDEYDLPQATPSCTFPTNSGQFYPAFERAVRKLDGVVRKLVVDGLTEWLAALSAEVAVERTALDDVLALTPEQLRERAEKHPLELNRHRQLGFVLRRAADPALLVKRLLADLDQLPEAATDLAAAYPLPRDRAFAWSSKLRGLPRDQRPPDYLRHQGHMYQVRDELLAAVRRLTQERLEWYQRQVFYGDTADPRRLNLLGVLTDFNARLDVLVNREAAEPTLIELFRPADTTAEAAADDPRALFRQLATL